jgi:DNA repair exonuclease SbcCD nuclease subunit
MDIEFDSIIGDRVTFCGDMHLNSTRPASRIDDYPATSLEKINQIRERMMVSGSKLLVVLGDVFHKREQSLSYLCSVADAFVSFKTVGIDVYTVVGNHDISYERMDTLKNQPLGLMFRAGLIKPLKAIKLSNTSGYDVGIYGYDYPDPIEPALMLPGRVRVCVAHRFYEYQYDVNSLTKQDVAKLAYNMYVLGHDHVKYKTERIDNKIVVRPGALLRGTSHQYNLEREVGVETVVFNGSSEKPKLSFISDVLDVKPASEIFTKASVEKTTSLAAITIDMTEQVNELIDQMGSVSADSSVYDYLDQLSIAPNVKECIERHLKEKGFFRREEEIGVFPAFGELPGIEDL